jgi:hypothetical protein
MTRRLCVLVGVAAFVAGAIFSPTIRPVVPTAEAATGSGAVGSSRDVLALNFRGTGHSEPVSEPGRSQFTADLYSLATNEKVGTATHNISPPSVIMDHVMTFHLPDGDLVAHSTESVVPDPQHPGVFLIGIHEDNNVVPEKGTGAYAGRTGKVTMSGWHDGNKLPEQATFNDFYLIELDPKS